jgi:hypothetical protein
MRRDPVAVVENAGTLRCREAAGCSAARRARSAELRGQARHHDVADEEHAASERQVKHQDRGHARDAPPPVEPVDQRHQRERTESRNYHEPDDVAQAQTTYMASAEPTTVAMIRTTLRSEGAARRSGSSGPVPMRGRWARRGRGQDLRAAGSARRSPVP